MEQKIGEIREILQAASVDELPAFIAAHEKMKEPVYRLL